MWIPNQTFLDRYSIERQLGQRQGRVTLLVSDRETSQRLVLKLLDFSSAGGWQDHKLFEREAALLKALSHPSIPQYVDFLDVDRPEWTGFVLVQTYIEARSLQEWMQSGRCFSESEVQQIAEGVLKVLAYLHNQRPPVIHRDIKPSNILLGDRAAHSVGPIYLVDFGAVQAHAVEGTQTLVGSYGYMPLEQFGGRAVPASDLYSLGTTLLEVLTGQHPADLLNDQHQLQYPPLPLNPIFKCWLQWLTQPHVPQRPGSAPEALDALRAIAHQEWTTTSDRWVWRNDRKQWTKAGFQRWQQPEDSRVRLQSRPNGMSCTVPASGQWSSGCLGGPLLSGFALLWNAGVLSMLWASLHDIDMSQPSSIFGFLLSLLITAPLWLPGLFLGHLALTLFYNLLFFRRTEICFFDTHTDWKKHYSVGPWQWTHGVQYPRLQKVGYVPSHFYDDVEAGRTRAGAQLEFHMGTRKETLSWGLSELELQWLAQELSENLQISREDVVDRGRE